MASNEKFYVGQSTSTDPERRLKWVLSNVLAAFLTRCYGGALSGGKRRRTGAKGAL